MIEKGHWLFVQDENSDFYSIPMYMAKHARMMHELLVEIDQSGYIKTKVTGNQTGLEDRFIELLAQIEVVHKQEIEAVERAKPTQQL